MPFIAFIVALELAWSRAVAAHDLIALAVMYFAVGFGVTLGFHRMLSHRAFTAGPALRVVLAVLGSMALQGPVIRWVADHRKHHTFADQPGDPHSPHTGSGRGWRSVALGLWHAHVGWMLRRQEGPSARRYAPDLIADPAIRFVDRWFPAWAALGIVVPGMLAFALSGGDPDAALTGMLWGGLVRIFLFHHVTWSVNSICHLYGRREFATRDESRNNWVLGVLALGEGWHHNHHAFPTSARHGLRRTQPDASYLLILLLERFGLVTDVRRPSAQQLSQRAARPRAPVH